MADAATWAKRVRAWRASGKTAESFSAGREFAPGTLRWWSWRLDRQAVPKTRAALVRVARVIRTPSASVASSSIVVELRGARVVVPSGADRTTLETVLELLSEHAGG